LECGLTTQKISVRVFPGEVLCFGDDQRRNSKKKAAKRRPASLGRDANKRVALRSIARPHGIQIVSRSGRVMLARADGF
jgi:hypothetical protein